MPEAFAVVLILVVSVAAYVGGLLQARRPILDYAAERGRVMAQQQWLRERLAMARKENWDRVMVAEIERQLLATTMDLEKFSGR